MTTPAADRSHRTSRRRYMVAPAALLSLAIIYALGGFVFAPWLAQRELPRMVDQHLSHTLTIRELSFNPFTLTLRASDVALADKTGKPLVGFAGALVDLRWRSLIRGSWGFSEIRLVDPSVNIAIDKQGRLNLDALLTQSNGSTPSQPLPLVIDHLVIENGRAGFEDQRENYRTAFEHLSLELHSLSTLQDEHGAYALAGQTSSGAKLRWTGELGLNPVVASGKVVIENLLLSEFNPFLDDYTTAKIVAGHADLEIPYRYAPGEAKPGQRSADALIVTGAALKLRELALQAPGAPAPFAKLSLLSLVGVDADLQKRLARAQTLSIVDLALAAKRDARGELDLSALVKSAPGAKPERTQANEAADSPPGWRGSIDAFELSNGSAEYSDALPKTPLTALARGMKAKFKLDADSKADGIIVRLSSGELSLADASLGQARKEPDLKLTDIRVGGARFDSGESALAVETLQVGKVAVNAVLEHGRLTMLDLLPTDAKTSAASAKSKDKAFMVRAKSVQLADGGISFSDRERGIALALERIRATLTEFSSDENKPLQFELDAGVHSGGRISARGRAVPGTGAIDARISASGVALAPIKPLLAKYADVQLTGGEAALAGTLKTSDKGSKGPKLSYVGSAGIANIAFDDRSGTRLLGWKSLATDSLRLTLSPDSAEITELQWTAPAGALAIATDGSTNLSRAFATTTAEPPKPQQANAQQAAVAQVTAPQAKSPPPAAAGTSASEEQTEDTFPVTVRRLYVTQGQLEFSDASVSPGFKARIYDLAGSANGIASDRSTRSNFALEGRVDEFGYAHL